MNKTPQQQKEAGETPIHEVLWTHISILYAYLLPKL